MERRGQNLRKGVLKNVLPFIRWLPLPTVSGILAGFGKLEYRLHPRLRSGFLRAVGQAKETLRCDWDVPTVSKELAGNQIVWRARDMILDGVSEERAEGMFVVAGREHLDEALGQKRGCIVLTSHFGAHMLPAHWLFRRDYSVRLYMEKPRNISKYMSSRFTAEGPLGQDKLFISRKGEATDSAGSILRAARVLRSGMCLFMAGDVRWTGQMTEEGVLLGKPQRFSTTWVVLAALTGAPVVTVFCRIGPDRRYHLEFRPAFLVPRDVEQTGQVRDRVQSFLDQVDDQIRRYPTNSNDYLFWDANEEQAA
jgi:lauroyl/myristoyl acyltransferase